MMVAIKVIKEEVGLSKRKLQALTKVALYQGLR